MDDVTLGYHLLVAMAFLAGIVFGMVLDAYILPFLVDTRIRMLRDRER